MAFAPGDLILDGKYRIEKLIGEGAFAQIYLATHLGLDFPRALKILRKDAPGLGSSEFQAFQTRFKLEAQLGARLDHPNIVRVYDQERVGDILVLVMEYLPGGSLENILDDLARRGEFMPIERALQLAGEIARGLAALHAIPVVHRDLKPSNILLDERGVAKVGDLGLAQMPGGPSLRSRLSHAERHPGTMGYMSPEQDSQLSLLQPPSDIYALGLVLFEMLTGKKYSYLRPGTPASRSRAELPGWLDELLLKFLAKDPEERPWDGAEAAEELKNALILERQRQAELHRLAEINQLITECEAAVADENWSSAETALTRLRELDAHDAIPRLEEAIAQGRHAAEQRRAEVAILVAAGLAALEAEDWLQAEEIDVTLRDLGKEGLVASKSLHSNLLKARRQAAARQQKLAHLDQQASQAIAAREWLAAESALAALRGLGMDGEARAEVLYGDYKLAREETDRRLAEIDRLREMVEAALAAEDWLQAENALSALSGLGAEGETFAGQLARQLERAREDALKRQEKISSLKAEHAGALDREDWAAAECAISSLSTLGRQGTIAATDCREQAEAAQRAAQERDQKIAALAESFGLALAQEAFDQAGQALQLLDDLGVPGQQTASRLRSQLEQKQRQVAQRQAAIADLTSQAQAAMDREDWGVVETALTALKDLGQAGEDQAGRIGAALELARQKAEKRDQEIARLLGVSEAALLIANWKKVQAGIDRLKLFGGPGNLAGQELAARLKEARNQHEARRQQVGELVARINAGISAGDLEQAQEDLDLLAGLGSDGEKQAATLRKRLGRLQLKQGFQPALADPQKSRRRIDKRALSIIIVIALISGVFWVTSLIAPGSIQRASNTISQWFEMKPIVTVESPGPTLPTSLETQTTQVAMTPTISEVAVRVTETIQPTEIMTTTAIEESSLLPIALPLTSPEQPQLLYTGFTSSTNNNLYLISTDGSNKTLLAEADNGTWSPDGKRIAISTSDGLSVGEFLENDEIKWTLISNSGHKPSWSPDGFKIAYGKDGEIYSISPDGSENKRLTNSGSRADSPVWSPDTNKILYTLGRTGNRNIYKANSDGRQAQQLTNSYGDDYSPVWSPDGQKIAFVSSRNKNLEIYIMNHDGSDQTRLTNNSSQDYAPNWASDGSRIAFVSWRDGNPEIYSMNPDGADQIRLTNDSLKDDQPVWSPDSKRIVFYSNRDKDNGLYIMDADGNYQEKLATLVDSDYPPVWEPILGIPNLPATLLDEKNVPMSLIPGGEFSMGNNNTTGSESPEHIVNIDSFYIDQYEVTNTKYAACVEIGICTPPGSVGSSTRESYYTDLAFAAYPVVFVTWQQAQAYCNWRGGRLPTEAEWEKAAAGGLENGKYPWGDEEPACQENAKNGAQFYDCKIDDTVAVGSYKPNGFSLFDMAGNGWEWTSSIYKPYPYNSNDGREDMESKDARTIRGGAWHSFEVDLRVDARNQVDPLSQSSVLGFRCARSVEITFPIWNTPEVAVIVSPTAVIQTDNTPTSSVPRSQPAATSQPTFPPPIPAEKISLADGMVQRAVPASNFIPGPVMPDYEPPQEGETVEPVYLDTFWIDKTEITNQMFTRFADQTGYQTDAEEDGWGYVWQRDGVGGKVTGADWKHPRGPKTTIDGLESHPVVQVSWSDAIAYCQWAGRKLPTQAQWEKAAIGTDGQLYPWGDQKPDGNLLNFANNKIRFNVPASNREDGYEFTAPVGSYPAGASPYGVLDMAGNVWEWLMSTHVGIQIDLNYNSGYTMISYYHSQDVGAQFTTKEDPRYRSDRIGFRCVEPYNNNSTSTNNTIQTPTP